MVIESISTVVYDYLGSPYGVGTFTNLYCGIDLRVHWPAIKITQLYLLVGPVGQAVRFGLKLSMEADPKPWVSFLE